MLTAASALIAVTNSMTFACRYATINIYSASRNTRSIKQVITQFGLTYLLTTRLQLFFFQDVDKCLYVL